ncbi:MAG: polysaccharide biosynthesis C-terminal domain-containing protein, partial [Chloroflexi bacterium]|nr:polysaccharide biosynthesis C-terminal domain-containing protein [Chloroflexota bacterium]
LLMKRARPVPRIQTKALRSQLSFGLRSNFGFVLEATNHRLDVFLVAGIAGAAALGHYAVAFGAAELLWRIPFALGAVFFPKVAALGPEANAETATTTLRRALFIILLATLIILPFGRLLIGGLYGEEFLPGVNAFYILAPSALLYTVFRILNASLAGMGRPESGIYAGVVSLPLTIGLSLLLIPRMGIVGAAIASMAAYGAAAAVVLVMFLWVTRKSLMETLVINRDDITSSIQTARTLLARSEAT